MRDLTLVLCFSTFFAIVSAGADPSWAILNMTVRKTLTDMDYFWTHAPVLIGSPPQTVPLVVNLGGSVLAAWAGDRCPFCPGKFPCSQLYDPTMSSTYIGLNKPWPGSTPQLSGPYVSDIVDFGGVLNASQTEFVRVDDLSTQFPQRYLNGHLGTLVPQNATSRSTNVFYRLWKEGKLLNPVMGFRFDANKSRMTIGALDSSDYEGTINWVQLETEDPTWDFLNTIRIDGMKGYNGSFIPWGSNLRATLTPLFQNIKVPNTWTYLSNDDFIGPITGNISLWSDPINAEFGYPCTLLANETAGTTQYVALTATINGVDYPIDSAGNLARPPSLLSKTGVCNVGITNRTNSITPIQGPEIMLSMPFLRSVYLYVPVISADSAYRFPTDDCPGYYGFAYPRGANRTEAQKAQQPRSTPGDASRCLNLKAPTSTPSAISASSDLRGKLSTSTFSVYKNEKDGQVHLVGWNELDKTVSPINQA